MRPLGMIMIASSVVVHLVDDDQESRTVEPVRAPIDHLTAEYLQVKVSQSALSIKPDSRPRARLAESKF